jgi:hypothetical protein
LLVTCCASSAAWASECSTTAAPVCIVASCMFTRRLHCSKASAPSYHCSNNPGDQIHLQMNRMMRIVVSCLYMV